MTNAATALDRAPLSLYVLSDSQNRDAWLKDRLTGIGASEIAALFGVSPWSSPYSVWAEKTGKVEGPDLSDRETVFWGNALETAIVHGYAKRTGRPVVPFGLLLRSLAHPVLLATPDALTTDDESAGARLLSLARVVGQLRRQVKSGRVVSPELCEELVEQARGWFPLQVKNVSGWSAAHWVDGAPEYYRLQVMQEALVLGAEKATAAALVGGQKLVWEDVARDELTDRRIVSLANKFWREHVEADVAPEVDASDATADAIKRRYPAPTPGETRVLSVELQDEADRLDRLKAEIKRLKDECTRLENRAKDALGDAELAVFPDGSGYSYKLTEKKAFTVAASTCRTLRRTYPKKEKR